MGRHEADSGHDYPRAVEAIIREFDVIDEFQIVLERVALLDEITVHAELKPSLESRGGTTCSSGSHRAA